MEAFNDPVIQASERGVIIGVNEPALKLFGYKKHEMIGKNVTIIMPPDYGAVHAQYLLNYMGK
jgi:PAS domain S-box-containing protein